MVSDTRFISKIFKTGGIHNGGNYVQTRNNKVHNCQFTVLVKLTKQIRTFQVNQLL